MAKVTKSYCVLAGWPVVLRKKGAYSLKMISPSRPGNTSPPMRCSARGGQCLSRQITSGGRRATWEATAAAAG